MVANSSRPRWSATRERVIYAWSRMVIAGDPPTPEAVARMTGLSVRTAQTHTRELRGVYGAAERKLPPGSVTLQSQVDARASILRANQRLVVLEGGPPPGVIEKAVADYRRAWRHIRSKRGGRS